MICSQCGSVIDKADSFCRSCGAALNGDAELAAQGSRQGRGRSGAYWAGVIIWSLVALLMATIVWHVTIGYQVKIRDARQAINNVASACSAGNAVVLAQEKVLADQAIAKLKPTDQMMYWNVLINKEKLLGCANF